MFRPVASLVPMGDNLIVSFRHGGNDDDENQGSDPEIAGTVTDLHLFRYDDKIGDLLHLKTD